MLDSRMPVYKRMGSSEEESTPTNVKKSTKDVLPWKQPSQPIPTRNFFSPLRPDSASLK
jgi:hypothetical protein